MSICGKGGGLLFELELSFNPKVVETVLFFSNTVVIVYSYSVYVPGLQEIEVALLLYSSILADHSPPIAPSCEKE